MNRITLPFVCIGLVVAGASAQSQVRNPQAPRPARSAPAWEKPASSSLMAEAVAKESEEAAPQEHALQAVSLFAVAAPKVRTFHKHDLVQIIVQETSRAKSSQELDSEKDYRLKGEIKAWPDFRVNELLQLMIMAGRTTNLPKLEVRGTKDFEGEGEYERRDDLTARLTAEVIEVLPNGHLVLEARTYIKTDEEEATMKLTGICRAEDVSPANTVLSSQIHDLEIEKMHKGELKNAAQKGFLAKVLDFIIAF